MADLKADWDWEDVTARLRKRSASLAKLERQHDRQKRTLYQVKTRRWPEAQAIIANALGVKPQEIWPSRYLSDGSPKTGPATPARIPQAKPSTGGCDESVESGAVEFRKVG